MNKKVLAIILLFFCMICLPAFAQENPIDPNQEEIWEEERLINEAIQKGYYGGTLDIRRVKLPTLDGELGEWIVTFDNTDGKYVRLAYGLFMKDYRNSLSWIYHKEVENLDKSQLTLTYSSCPLVTGGDYAFGVYLYGAGNYLADFYYDVFTIGDMTLLTNKITEIVNSCLAETLWQTAVNLHDWLTLNMYYDHNLEYHGADAILRGYGVCDSYSKAYIMLCQAAGIPVGRIRGGGHAWNAIQLEGEWYYVDATWDDPGNAQVPESGIENHHYFCVNEEALTSDHTILEYEDEIGDCTSMDMNYYFVTGEWRSWGLDTTTTILSNIKAAFTDGPSEYSFASNSRLYDTVTKNSLTNSFKKLLKFVYGYALERETLTMSNGIQIHVKASVDDSKFTVTLEGWAIEETGTLILPPNLTTVPSEGFYGTGATTVIIPDGCTSISSGAFAYSKVRTVNIPDSVTDIDDTAFNGCGKIIFVTSNQTAIDYASEKGMWVAKP